MAGTWIMIKQAGKTYITPFTFSAEEVDNIRYNSPKGEKYKFINIVTRATKTVTGAGLGTCKSVIADRKRYGRGR